MAGIAGWGGTSVDDRSAVEMSGVCDGGLVVLDFCCKRCSSGVDRMFEKQIHPPNLFPTGLWLYSGQGMLDFCPVESNENKIFPHPRSTIHDFDFQTAGRLVAGFIQGISSAARIPVVHPK
jgi:hypothetical protein